MDSYESDIDVFLDIVNNARHNIKRAAYNQDEDVIEEYLDLSGFDKTPTYRTFSPQPKKESDPFDKLFKVFPKEEDEVASKEQKEPEIREETEFDRIIKKLEAEVYNDSTLKIEKLNTEINYQTQNRNTKYVKTRNHSYPFEPNRFGQLLKTAVAASLIALTVVGVVRTVQRNDNKVQRFEAREAAYAEYLEENPNVINDAISWNNFRYNILPNEYKFDRETREYVEKEQRSFFR